MTAGGEEEDGNVKESRRASVVVEARGYRDEQWKTWSMALESMLLPSASRSVTILAFSSPLSQSSRRSELSFLMMS